MSCNIIVISFITEIDELKMLNFPVVVYNCLHNEESSFSYLLRQDTLNFHL